MTVYNIGNKGFWMSLVRGSRGLQTLRPKPGGVSVGDDEGVGAEESDKLWLRKL